MKNFEERKAEIMLRADKQIKKRKQAQKRVLTAGIPLCVCLCVTAVMFWMPSVQPNGSEIVSEGLTDGDGGGGPGWGGFLDGTKGEAASSGDLRGEIVGNASDAESTCDLVESSSSDEAAVSEEIPFEGYGSAGEADSVEDSSSGIIASGGFADAWIDAASQLYAVVKVQTVDEAKGGLVRTECELLYMHRETVAGYPEELQSGSTVELYFPAAESEGICAADELLVILSAFSADNKTCLQAAKDENGRVCIALTKAESALPPEIAGPEEQPSNGEEPSDNNLPDGVLPEYPASGENEYGSLFAGLEQLNLYVEELEAGERTEPFEEAFPDSPFSEEMTAKEAIAFLEQINNALNLKAQVGANNENA